MTENKDINPKKYVERLTSDIDDSLHFMEVCGTHTVEISKMGIRSLLEPKINLVSGPGCPVCVTDESDLANIMALAELDDVIITTFGDMLKIPVGEQTLANKKAAGKDIRILYSSEEALQIALDNRNKEVIFVAVGFETTQPTIAATILRAYNDNIDNFHIYPSLKLIPPALKLLCESPDLNIDGFILPGHVSSIIGVQPYKFISEEYSLPCSITGFEPEDIMDGLYQLKKQLESDEPEIYNSYNRVVSTKGNRKANKIVDEVFEPTTVKWRGIGELEDSGLKLGSEYKEYSAYENFDIEPVEYDRHSECKCGEVIMGRKKPGECPLFKKVCTPANPKGPCMVSTEGSCAAYFKYGK